MPDAALPGPVLAPPAPGLTVMVTALVALGPLTMSTYTPAMPAIAAALGTSAGMVQATLSVYLAGFALAQLAYGPLSDRFGRRGVTLLGLGIFVLGTLLCGLAGSVELLLAGRLVQAVGACAGAALGRAIVRDAFGREQAARVLALIGMALAVAPAVGPVLGGYLQRWLGWPAIFAVLGLAGLALLAAAARRLPETNACPDPHALRPGRLVGNYGTLLRDPRFLGYTVVSAATLGGSYTFHAAAPFLVIGRLGVGPELYGWLNLFTVGAYAAASWAVSRFGGRLGLERGIALGALLALAAIALLLAAALADRLAVAMVVGPMAVWAAATGLVLPNAMAGALAPFPRMAGAASALMGFLQMAAGALGSVAVGRFGTATPLPCALTLMGFAVLGYGMWFALVWRRAGPA